ncbi:glycosyltransferase family 4 protein [Acinetobacter rudis]|uniref:Glycosyltransferase family 4 protein n=1 Tax=Acinetobacter rudis TaxID=632955 RepID=A0AAW8J8U4_9GAMM|nr:glycosyltransferase family 4 protein [Acinetobacter rudis]MDQ8936586.1 glycosyltransferase family 4 protein [Acinetobacter rudis]MDQ8954178.1 glycosyltransferase family 4 protein [Acinetobacter rudis]MDQ9018847.1 glycosyltransferase family 4 protein [Acinetobacter rudis]
MKTLKIINTVYGDATGGRWQAVLDIANTLKGYGHNVVLLRGKENAHLNSGEWPIDVIANTGFYSISAALKIRQYIHEQQPDVIIAHSGKAVWLFKNAMIGMKKKIPIIAVNHSHNVKRTIRADAFLHITPYVQSLVQALQTESDRVNKPHKVISNLTYLPKVEANPQHLKKPVNIAMLTRMVPNKGVHILIEALALLKKRGVAFTAILAGQGEQLENYKALANQLGLTEQVQFPGWIGGDEKIAIIQNADIIALPSITEIQGIGILDAFAWGKTLITTDDIGIQQTAKHKINAWCAKAGDAESLADGFEYLISHPDEAFQMAVQGKKEALEKYCFEQIAKQHQALVSEVYCYYQEHPL